MILEYKYEEMWDKTSLASNILPLLRDFQAKADTTNLENGVKFYKAFQRWTYETHGITFEIVYENNLVARKIRISNDAAFSFWLLTNSSKNH